MDGQHNHHIRQVWGREPRWYLCNKHWVVFVECVFFWIFSIWREPRWYLWNKHWVVNYSPPAHLLLTRNRANIGKDRPVNRVKWGGFFNRGNARFFLLFVEHHDQRSPLQTYQQQQQQENCCILYWLTCSCVSHFFDILCWEWKTEIDNWGNWLNLTNDERQFCPINLSLLGSLCSK